MSEITEKLWADYEDFCKRDLSEHAVAYLFIDGIAERLRPGQRREAVLAAWGIGEDGRKSLLGLMAGSKEDVETVRAFFQDLRARGLGDPLLVVSAGRLGFRLFLHAGAYWLMWGLRVSMPKRSMWRVAQFDTLRLRLIKIAARVVEMKTMIRVHLPTSCPAQDILRFALGRIPRLVT